MAHMQYLIFNNENIPMPASYSVNLSDVEADSGGVTEASITVGYLDMETMNIVDTQMYIDGYQVKLVSDTSYGSLWEVSFTLKEF